MFNAENSVSLLWGLTCPIEELALGKSWKSHLERLCGKLEQAKAECSVFLALLRSAWTPDNCTSLTHPLQGLFSLEKRKLRDKSWGIQMQKILSKSIHDHRQPQGVKGIWLGWWGGVFLLLGAITEVKSDPGGCWGVSSPGRLADGRKLHHRGDFPCFPMGEERWRNFPWTLSNFAGALPLVWKSTSSKHLERPVPKRKLISKRQLNETPFEFGSCPALNQQGQAENETALMWLPRQNFES